MSFVAVVMQRGFVLFLPFLSLISTAELQNRTVTSSNSNVVACGNTRKMVDECFKDLPPHLVEFLQSTRIATDADEIKSKCTVFDRGMKCFEDYTTRCIEHKKWNIIKNNVEGARNFFGKFCTDRDFQNEYLRNKECFSHIQHDWDRCYENFANILRDELSSEQANGTTSFMEFCCARYGFENCIYNSARYKCYPTSAKFARETAKILSEEKHFSSCRQYENALCLSDNSRPLWPCGAWKLICSCMILLCLMLLLLRP